MKSLFKLGIAAAIAITAFSCKKESNSKEPEYIDGYTRVIGVKGTDTSSTRYVHARTESISLLVSEDSKLKAELISYTPLPGGKGRYVVKMTNKQSCQMILRWNYQNIGPIDPQPDDATANTSQSDVIKANQVKTYIIIGKAIAGKIFVKAEHSNSDCPNSSQLILEITTTILPIEFTSITVTRNEGNMNVKFSTEEPQGVDWFYIMWTPDGNPINEKIVAYVASDYITKDYKLSFPAIRKEGIK